VIGPSWYAQGQTLGESIMRLHEPSVRGRGIGNKAYKVLEEWAVSQQFNRVRLGVLFGNEKGLKFLEKDGLC